MRRNPTVIRLIAGLLVFVLIATLLAGIFGTSSDDSGATATATPSTDLDQLVPTGTAPLDDPAPAADATADDASADDASDDDTATDEEPTTGDDAGADDDPAPADDATGDDAAEETPAADDFAEDPEPEIAGDDLLGVDDEIPEFGPSGLPAVSWTWLPPEAFDTLELIDSGGPFPFDRDDIEFQNREGLLPDRERGYYREYTVITPGSSTRGARRIVAGDGGELYWTADHYESFEEIVDWS